MHKKIEGEHLLAVDYTRLPEAARDRLAADLAGFYAEVHSLEIGRITDAGGRAIAPWQPIDAIRARAFSLLPTDLRPTAVATLDAFEQLPPDPYGIAYGFFDGHGWNMAFDHSRQRLNGIYDFADSGIGPLHQDFIYSNFISRDLTSRIVAAYEVLTGRLLDRARITILTGVHRLSELAELADDPVHAPTMVNHAVDWLAEARSLSR